jgi:hypothetical protein
VQVEFSPSTTKNKYVHIKKALKTKEEVITLLGV